MNILWTDGNDFSSAQSRALLNTKLVEFEERDVSGNFWSKEDFYKEYPNRSIPLTIFDDKVIGGWDDLFWFYANQCRV
jgi:glutaredoxin